MIIDGEESNSSPLYFLQKVINMELSKIILTPTAIMITDYDYGSCPSLEYNFKSYDPLTHKIEIMGMYYDSNNRVLYLPRSMDTDFIFRKLESKNFNGDYYRIDTYPYNKFSVFDKQIKLKYAPRDERQIKALQFMLCQGEYSYNIYRTQFAVNLPTGAGKTYCSTATIAFLNIKSIVITAQSSILDQWKNDILDYTNLDESDICKIEGSAVINRILSNKSNLIHKKIYLVTHSTLKSFGDSNGWNKVTELFEKLQIGLKFFDEAHQNFSNMCMIDFYTNVYRTYYVTATPKRSNKDENKIYSIYMKGVPAIQLFDEDSDPHTRYIAIRYNSHPTQADIYACKNKTYGLDRNKYVRYLMSNENFWYMFDHLFNLIEKQGGRALFYIGINDAIEKIKQRIIYLYPEYANDVGIYTSISDNKQAEREKRFILSTTKSAGAGEDIKGLKYSVVLAEPFKSEVLAQQTLGRTRDNNTYYIELVDTGFRQTNAFYNAKKKIFNTYALSTKQIDVPQSRIKELYQSAYSDRIERCKRGLEFNVSPMVKGVEFFEGKGVPGVIFTDR